MTGLLREGEPVNPEERWPLGVAPIYERGAVEAGEPDDREEGN